MIYCKDCKFFEDDSVDGKCNYPLNTELSFVTGEQRNRYSAKFLREDGYKKFCGPDGKWFEPK